MQPIHQPTPHSRTRELESRMIPTEQYLVLSAALFVIGAAGVLIRRNAIFMLMSIELMLNAVNLAFVAFARNWGDLAGQAFVLFVMTVAAAEVAVGLALMVVLFRVKNTLDTDHTDLLRW